MGVENKGMQDWKECLRIMLLGNSIIENLSEANVEVKELSIQINEMQQILLEDTIEEEQKELIRDELKRQISYMNEFHVALGNVVTVYSKMTEEAHHG